MTTRNDTTKDPAARKAALSLLSKGLLTQAEAAQLAGVSRQLMRHWAREVPAIRNREALLAKLWRKELAQQQ